MTRFLPALAWCLGMAHAADDPLAALDRATNIVLATTRKIPNYTCVETVERNYYNPLASNLRRACSVILEQRLHPTLDLTLRLHSTDRLRFDVAMLQRGEIFSWVGASRFEDEDHGISGLVRSGPIGTGAFASFLSLVFDQDVRKFVYKGTVEEDGRKLLEFAFDVPAADSHYRVQVRDSWIHTPYSGTFLVDPAADTVVRLTAHTAEMPPASGSCMTTTTLNFAMVRIGKAEFLLTKNARQRFVAPDGRETENTTTFADCREYLGESTVTYETVEPAAARAREKAVAKKPRAFSPGLRFRLVLDRAIDSSTAAAGDSFEARLLSPLRDSRQKLTAPAMALVRGRILRMQAFHTNPAEVVMVLRPETVQVGDAVIALPSMRDFSANRGKRVAIELPEPGEDHAGVFHFAGDRVVIPAFFRSDWRTVP
jgi:hypothetical protein